jgi:ribosomal protein S18 acetylase RimI-like enzyme
MHLLDNPIWTALTTRQTHFAQGGRWARRFPPAVTALAGFDRPRDEAYQELARLADGAPAALFLERAPDLPDGWLQLREAVLLQMVHQSGAAPSPRHQWVALTEVDVPEMLALAELTQPGPFGARTYQMGTYLGIRSQGTLVAMAGERLRVPGYAEISAVCTHPDHGGKGYAASLMSVLIEKMRGEGETAFLHVREDNLRAIALYERLGFRKRVQFHLAVLQKESPQTEPVQTEPAEISDVSKEPAPKDPGPMAESLR